MKYKIGDLVYYIRFGKLYKGHAYIVDIINNKYRIKNKISIFEFKIKETQTEFYSDFFQEDLCV